VNVGQRFAWLRAVVGADPRPTMAEMAAAITLAEHYNQDRGAAWPAQRTMAAMTRTHLANIRRALIALEARGFIEKLDPGGPRSSARFALIMPPERAVEPTQSAPHSALRDGHTARSERATQPTEQAYRSDNVGKPYPAATARSPYGSRTRGGGQANNQKPRRTAQPVTPLKL